MRIQGIKGPSDPPHNPKALDPKSPLPKNSSKGTPGMLRSQYQEGVGSVTLSTVTVFLCYFGRSGGKGLGWTLLKHLLPFLGYFL